MYGRERTCLRPLQKLQKNRTLHRLSRNNPSLVNPIIFTLSRKLSNTQTNKTDDFSDLLPIVDITLFTPPASSLSSLSEEIQMSTNKELKKLDSITEEIVTTPVEVKKKKSTQFILPDGVIDVPDNSEQLPSKPNIPKKKIGCGGVLTRSKRWEIPPKKKKERFHASDLHKQIWEKHVKHKEEQKKFGFTPKSSCGCG